MIHPNRLNFPFLVLFWIVCTCFVKKAAATHTYGAELSYQCLGNNQYEVQLILVRDCNGIGFPNQSFVDINSVNCGINIGVVALALDTVYEISQTCSSVISACNGGNTPSVENYIYRGLVTFPQVCTDWVVSWSNCCRSSAITNLATSSTNFYLEAGINNTTCSSSPVLMSRPFMYFCAGNCYEYNYGGYDPDGDTLKYALTCPLRAANTCIPNVAGTQPTQPLFTNPSNTFNFNENTGQMSFCPNGNQSQYIVLDITSYQVSNGDTIGYTQRGIQLFVLNSVTCTKPPTSTSPVITGGGTFDSINQIFENCSGDVLSFETIVYHPEGLPIYLDSLNTNLDVVVGVGNWTVTLDTLAPYRPDSAHALIQVTTSEDQIGMNYFTLSFRDASCPFNWLETKGYQLSVLGIKASIVGAETYCPGIDLNIPLKTKQHASNEGTYVWTQIAGPTITFSNDTVANPVLMLPNTTQDGDTIVIRVTYTSGGCVSTDDISIYTRIQAMHLEVLASDTFLCPNGQADTIDLRISVGNPSINTTNGIYTWNANPINFISNLMNSTGNRPFLVLDAIVGDTITYQVKYDYGLCTDSVDLRLRARPGTLVVNTTLDSICAGDTVQLTAILTDTTIVIDTTACHRYVLDSIPFGPIQGSGTSVFLGDDEMSFTLPIGFDFEFYCTTYNQFKISSNGFITFDTLSSLSGCCSGQLLPDATAPNALIALCWEDLAPHNGGTIEYFTVGIAPNRQLVVNFINVPRLGGSNTVTVQAVLYEGTNLIDIHNTSITGGSLDVTTQGIENNTGTVGTAVWGRNGVANWSANNDAFRFTPGDVYALGPITYNWTPSAAVSNEAIYNPLGTPLQTTTYFVRVNEQECLRTDSVDVVLLSVLNAPIVRCDSSATFTNSILFEWGQVVGATGWQYSLDSGGTWITSTLQDSAFLYTGLQQGTCYGIWVRPLDGGGGACPFNAARYLECCTDLLSNVVIQNGSTFSAVQSGSTITYQWIDCNNGNALIVGATGQSFTPTVNGSYAVIISDGINTITSDCMNINITNTTSIEEGEEIYCYPNPTTGQISIEKSDTKRIDVRVLDPLGRVVLEQTTNSLKTNLDLSPYPIGVYIFQFKTANQRFSQKIIKQ